MSDLYAYFGCTAKEELYELVKEENQAVQSLIDFIEYSKSNLNGEQSIVSPDLLFEAIKEEKMPGKGEVLCLFVNTKNKPVHLGRMTVDDKKSRVLTLKEGLGAGAVDVFLVENNSSEHVNFKVEDYFDQFGVSVMDTMDYSKHSNTLKSRADGIRRTLTTSPDKVVEQVALYDLEKSKLETRQFASFKQFDEFSSFYSTKEIEKLNIFKDAQKIQEILKVGYQYDWQESFGVISCDENGKVLAVSELFKGTTDTSLIDRKVITKELLSNPDVKFVAAFHNHPSGVPLPSNEDRNMTSRLKSLTAALDTELLDHLIIGKEGVYSFAKEYEESISINEKYLEALELDSEIKKLLKHSEKGFLNKDTLLNFGKLLVELEGKGISIADSEFDSDFKKSVSLALVGRPLDKEAELPFIEKAREFIGHEDIQLYLQNNNHLKDSLKRDDYIFVMNFSGSNVQTNRTGLEKLVQKEVERLGELIESQGPRIHLNERLKSGLGLIAGSRTKHQEEFISGFNMLFKNKYVAIDTKALEGPSILIEWSEHNSLPSNALMPYREANELMEHLERTSQGDKGYHKTKYHLLIPHEVEDVEIMSLDRLDIGDGYYKNPHEQIFTEKTLSERQRKVLNAEMGIVGIGIERSKEVLRQREGQER